MLTISPGIPCLPPPDIDNGRHTEGDGGEYNHGIVVIYTCFKDFSLIGSESITCETAPDGINGQWNGPAPECKGDGKTQIEVPPVHCAKLLFLCT